MKLRWLVLMVVLTGTFAFWGCGSSSTGPSACGELEGTWCLNDTLYKLSFTFANNNWTVVEEIWYDQDTTFTWNGTFTSNTTVIPKTIDFLCSSSPYSYDVGKTALGIYELNTAASQLTLATSDFGDTVRPTEFGSYSLILTKQ